MTAAPLVLRFKFLCQKQLVYFLHLDFLPGNLTPQAGSGGWPLMLINCDLHQDGRHR